MVASRAMPPCRCGGPSTYSLRQTIEGPGMKKGGARTQRDEKGRNGVGVPIMGGTNRIEEGREEEGRYDEEGRDKEGRDGDGRVGWASR